MVSPEENRAADRRALLQAAATILAGGNSQMNARHAVEVALEIEAVIREVMAGLPRRVA
jgi:hypothetical protein